MLQRCCALWLCVLTTVLAGCSSAPAVNIEATVAAGVAATQAAAGPTNTPRPTDAPTGGKWRVSGDTSSFDDSRTVVLTLRAEAPYTESWLSRTHTATLLLRCRERRTEVFVDVGFAPKVETGLLDQGRARFRVDQGEARTEFMSRSTDDKSLFFDDPHGIIGELERAERLLFGYTPINANPVETSFDVRGLADVLPQLREACPPPTGPSNVATGVARPPAPPTPVPTPVDPAAPATVDLARLLARSPGEEPRSGGWVCATTEMEAIGRAVIVGETWYQIRIVRNPNCPAGAAVNRVGWLPLGEVTVQN